ncbi:MAG: Hydrolase, alpha/beta domain protein [Solirubrobacterales bacterium]|nr:Hydrolase, alpha/beta domain protein [Solirubrobacterales bacterium]
MQDEVHVRVCGERTAGASVAEDEPQDVRRQVAVQELDEPDGRQRRLLRRLEDDRVPRHEARGHLTARDGDRVVPRHEQRAHTARLGDHQVHGPPIPLQRTTAVQRPDLRVLLDRADAGLDAAA